MISLLIVAGLVAVAALLGGVAGYRRGFKHGLENAQGEQFQAALSLLRGGEQ